ncbi:hypothetical protein CONCODRAFT_80732 [Conidiobolus coronatus NRRL 28638]|uniref:Zinc finger PHD-type domain-containing protein n=1 Tax=Conidiobolus coronatus (strain ATCC 28846 / CBS 209.66 / NRRL 28638) TaxID=796925 RepID=A0A137NSB5_CONC2|nr:hypothetical protein CONCODRAFT_80732 [Conidiobolus coronatus NRRL 28638]|eukprot:KXN65582.1 hypothetical protein CONCODRAFT_80732 [Conidiobolus coronatus NRRL 28638]
MQNLQNDQQESQCYCNGPIDQLGLEAMQQCQNCLKYFHFNCLKSANRPKLWLLSDRFWQLTCENSSKSSNVRGDHVYFRWKEDICRIIDLYWSELCPDRVRSPTWNNTVASALSTNSKIFLSGSQIFDIGGWWSLHQLVPPSLTQKALKRGSLTTKTVPTPVKKPEPVARKPSPPNYTPNKKTLPLKKYYIAKSKDGLSSDSDNAPSVSNSPSSIDSKLPSPKPQTPVKRPSPESPTHANIIKKPAVEKILDYSSDESSLTSLEDLQYPVSSPQPSEPSQLTSPFSQASSPLTSSPSPQYSHLKRVSNPTPRLTHQGLDNLVAELVGISNYGSQINE